MTFQYAAFSDHVARGSCHLFRFPETRFGLSVSEAGLLGSGDPDCICRDQENEGE